MVCTFFTWALKEKVKCHYHWYLACSSTLTGLLSSAGRSASTEATRKKRRLLHRLRGSSVDNLYKIYALNNKWTKHLEVIGCVKLHNRPESLSEQSQRRLNNEWGAWRSCAKPIRRSSFKSKRGWKLCFQDAKKQCWDVPYPQQRLQTSLFFMISNGSWHMAASSLRHGQLRDAGLSKTMPCSVLPAVYKDKTNIWSGGTGEEGVMSPYWAILVKVHSRVGGVWIGNVSQKRTKIQKR